MFGRFGEKCRICERRGDEFFGLILYASASNYEYNSIKYLILFLWGFYDSYKMAIILWK